jgi:PTH1 family peptidyl-tRNA hydrolase
MYLIAGLGNPGDKYKNTRHNIGFMVIDKITKSLNTTNINRSNFKSELYKASNKLLAKPQTFMNNSGESINAIAQYYNIENENIIIIHDDLDLPFGTIKYKKDGGHGGHNGLRSIDSHIGKDYIRVRIGIGKPNDKIQVANYVLNDFSKEETKYLDSIISHVINSLNALENISLEEVKSTFTLKANI